MLSKKHRFHGRGSLNYVYRKGSTVRSPFCAMRYVPGKYNTYRVAVVVGKKVTKSAPKRNLIRRRVYEALRLTAPKILTNQDVVITIFDTRFVDMPHSEMFSSLSRQLEQIAKNSRAKH